jgi:hypothetical protein
MKVLDIPGSGKLGVFVQTGGRYGQVRRILAIPTNPRSTPQLDVRERLTRESQAWRNLTQIERNAWIEAAKTLNTRPRLGQSGPMTGHQFFVKANCNLLLVGEAVVTAPPAQPTFDDLPVTAFSITNVDDEIAIKFTVSGAWAEHTLLRGATPLSQGIQVYNDFRVLGEPPVAVAGVVDVTSLYTARFGVPPVGKKVFLQLQQSINGYVDLPRQYEAIVPAAS